jgi:RNA recognition motif-containing protein
MRTHEYSHDMGGYGGEGGYGRGFDDNSRRSGEWGQNGCRDAALSAAAHREEPGNSNRIGPEDAKRTIFVHGLTQEAKKEEVMEAMSQFGPVQGVKLCSKGANKYGFVTFEDLAGIRKTLANGDMLKITTKSDDGSTTQRTCRVSQFTVNSRRAEPSGLPSQRGLQGVHAGSEGRQQCRFFSNGNCHFGSQCRFAHGAGEHRHPGTVQQHADDWDCHSCNTFNFSRRTDCFKCHLPRRDAQTEQPTNAGGAGACFDFQKGRCDRGEDCRFSHDLCDGGAANDASEGSSRHRNQRYAQVPTAADAPCYEKRPTMQDRSASAAAAAPAPVAASASPEPAAPAASQEADDFLSNPLFALPGAKPAVNRAPPSHGAGRGRGAVLPAWAAKAASEDIEA